MVLNDVFQPFVVFGFEKRFKHSFWKLVKGFVGRSKSGVFEVRILK